MNTLRSIGIVSASGRHRFTTASRPQTPLRLAPAPQVHVVVLSPDMTPEAKAARVVARTRQAIREDELQ